ncbi:Response regulator [Sulfidibacter corallicola]|uniref:Response regulator n=1 Tax=Sulfidibacter corallicola TaxID=2818388 RepID=A0A8A4TGY2_SULCO|nr:response regulator [Sulfidibacter corallicola]QTD48810.1 response regulator [Sulfidibacter corallicola]
MKKTADVHLLLIEDDDVDAMDIQRGFRKARIANPIIRAIDGQQAKELLTTGQVPAPFLIMMDIKMPRMDGHEFLRWLRDDPTYQDSIVFVLTTSHNDRDINKCYKHNIAGYFIKSETGKGFLDVVNLLDGFWRIVQFPFPKATSDPEEVPS